jgi:hypothetical protein
VRRAEGRELVGRAAILEAAPASMSGSTTIFSGLRIFAVSAMNLHAAKGDHLGVGRRALRLSSRLSPTKSARSWISGFW